MELVGLIPVVFAIGVALTNVIVNVMKAVFPVTKPKLLVVITSLLLTTVVGVGVGFYVGFNTWYLWAADIFVCVILGVVESYVAMFGYDEGYQEILKLFQDLITYVFGSGVK